MRRVESSIAPDPYAKDPGSGDPCQVTSLDEISRTASTLSRPSHPRQGRLENELGSLNLTPSLPRDRALYPGVPHRPEGYHRFPTGLNAHSRGGMSLVHPNLAQPAFDYNNRAAGLLAGVNPLGGMSVNSAALSQTHAGSERSRDDALMYQMMGFVQQGDSRGLDFTGIGTTGIGTNFNTGYTAADHQHTAMLGGILPNQMPAFPSGHSLSAFGPYGVPQPAMPQPRSLQELAAYQEVDRNLTQSLPLPRRPLRFDAHGSGLDRISSYSIQPQPMSADNLGIYGNSGQPDPSWPSSASTANGNSWEVGWPGSHDTTRQQTGPPQQPFVQKAGREMTPTLQDLVEHKLLHPGHGVIVYKHSGNDFVASLSPEGTIIFHGRVFQSPTSFATSCRGRTVSGWREVLYRGTRLDNYRSEFCKRFDAPHLVGPQDLEDKLRRMTLQELINAGYLTPDKDAVMLHHRGRFYTGTLTPDGFITYNGKAFGTPTGFAAHCTDSSPSRCRGWHRVTYMGHPLDHYRRLLCNQLFSPRESGSEAENVQARMMEQIEARRTTRPSAAAAAENSTVTPSSSTSRIGSPTPGSVPPATAATASEPAAEDSTPASRPASPSSAAPILPELSALGTGTNLHDFLLGFFAQFCEHFQVDAEDRAKTVRYVGLLISFVPEASARSEHYALMRFAYGSANGAALLRYISDTVEDMQRKEHGTSSVEAPPVEAPPDPSDPAAP